MDHVRRRLGREVTAAAAAGSAAVCDMRFFLPCFLRCAVLVETNRMSDWDCTADQYSETLSEQLVQLASGSQVLSVAGHKKQLELTDLCGWFRSSNQ
jgi:hypothetical protein